MTTITRPEHIKFSPTSASEVQELVRSAHAVLPHGAQTKSPLLQIGEVNEVTRLDMTRLSGILEYDPGEYTFTAFAGTPLAEIAAALTAHGQYMPFDPPLLDAGATLGGTIAAGLSGSGRYRYGGLRDFILGVELVDGEGRLIRGGGKVVKNAAGFDLPKLMVGSMGRLGIVLSASFKVFPSPPGTATLSATLPTLQSALAAQAKLMGGPFDLEALDIVPQPDHAATLLARIGGPADVLPARLQRLRSVIGTEITGSETILDDAALWLESREFAWASKDSLLVKSATTPRTLAQLDQALATANAARRYAAGGNLAWFAWPHSVEECDQLLARLGQTGLVIQGDAPRALVGVPLQTAFLQRVTAALDPSHRFLKFAG